MRLFGFPAKLKGARTQEALAFRVQGRMLVAMAGRVVSLMPPSQVIDTQHRVYNALKMCPLEQDAHAVTLWAMHNQSLDVIYEIQHDSFFPIVIIWIASLLLFTWIMFDKY